MNIFPIMTKLGNFGAFSDGIIARRKSMREARSGSEFVEKCDSEDSPKIREQFPE